jgi:hypothetical protein
VCVATDKPALICLTETWCNDNISDDLITPQHYTIYRMDRIGRVGGGVAICVRNDISSCCMSLNTTYPAPAECECLFIYLNTLKIVLCVIYIPPGLRAKVHQNILSYLTNFFDEAVLLYSTEKVIFCGDFNNFKTRKLETQFNLKKKVHSGTTTNNTILDQIFVSENLDDQYEKAIVGPRLGASYHHSVLLKPIICGLNFKKEVNVFDLRQSNVDKFVHDFYNSCAINLLNVSNLNSKCNILVENLHICLNNIPQHTVNMTSRDKPWITPILKHLINERWKAFREGNMQKYNFLKCKVKLAIAKAKLSWSSRQCKTTKGLWHVTNSTLGRNNTNNIDGIVND